MQRGLWRTHRLLVSLDILSCRLAGQDWHLTGAACSLAPIEVRRDAASTVADVVVVNGGRPVVSVVGAAASARGWGYPSATAQPRASCGLATWLSPVLHCYVRSLRFDVDRIGIWTDWKEFRVEQARIAAYAQATNDAEPLHLCGELAPPLFAVVPIGEATVEVERPVTSLYDQYLGLHGEHDIFFHGAIRPGMTVRTRAACVGLRPTSSGVILLIRTETRGDSGEPLSEQFLTSFYPGQRFEGDHLGERAPEHQFPEGLGAPLTRVTYQIDGDQAARYAEASGDRGAYHLNEAVALSVGLPGIILHGLCTMAFTSRAMVETVCGGDSTRLHRLAVRFSRPVRPGQQLTTVLWTAPEAGGRAVYAFEADADGETVIQHGRAEVAG